MIFYPVRTTMLLSTGYLTMQRAKLSLYIRVVLSLALSLYTAYMYMWFKGVKTTTFCEKADLFPFIAAENPPLI